MLITESCNAIPSLEPLSEADLELIALLGKSPRMTGTEIAQRLGTSEASVSRRLARLRAEGVIRFHAFVPPHLLGLHSQLTLYIDTDGDPAPAARELAKLPYLHFVASVAGRSEIVAFMLSRTGTAAVRRIDRDIVTIPGIVNVRSAPMMHYYTPVPFRVATQSQLQPLKGQPDAPTFDAVDLTLIAAAQRDGRATYSSLGAAAGLSPSAAASRLQKLIESGSLTVIACPAPARMGRMVTAILRMKILGPISPAAAAIDQLTGASYVVIAGGDWQVSVEVDVPDEESLASLAAEVRRLPSVGELQVLPLRAVHKDTYDWGAGTEESAPPPGELINSD